MRSDSIHIHIQIIRKKKKCFERQERTFSLGGTIRKATKLWHFKPRSEGQRGAKRGGTGLPVERKGVGNLTARKSLSAQ
jgi:hypothetical protein